MPRKTYPRPRTPGEHVIHLLRALRTVRTIAIRAGTPNPHLKKIIARVNQEIK